MKLTLSVDGKCCNPNADGICCYPGWCSRAIVEPEPFPFDDGSRDWGKSPFLTAQRAALPAFEVIGPTGVAVVRIWEDGRSEGLPPGVTVNRIPRLRAQAVETETLWKEVACNCALCAVMRRGDQWTAAELARFEPANRAPIIRRDMPGRIVDDVDPASR